MTRVPPWLPIIILVFLFLAALMPRDASSQEFRPGHMQVICARGADTVEKHVKEKYNESVVWVGERDGHAFMLYRSPDGTAWTFSSTDGAVGCVLTFGGASTVVDVPPAETESY